jgi:hypothetical protein
MTGLEHDKFRLTSAKWVSLGDSLRLDTPNFCKGRTLCQFGQSFS